MTTPPMPAVFLGHGSPMNALETNDFTRSWRDIGASMPRPKAILCVSAHWVTRGSAVTAMARPRTIHDFGRFPQALFEVRYPAPGDPALAERVRQLLAPTPVRLDTEDWGLDHGTWSVLVHAFPEASVPVIQLSVNGLEDFDAHFELGTRLAPLRASGILIMGSGNVVHNLGLIDPAVGETGFDWAVRFDQACTAAMTSDPSAVKRLVDHPDYRWAVPTPDHFLPLAPIAGLAAAGGVAASPLVEGYFAGSLSMTTFRVD